MAIQCKICNSQMIPIFKGTILKKYTVQYYKCPTCDYLCTEEPYWLEESYQNPINVSDTGLLSRNIHYSIISSCILFSFFQKDIKCLDYGGGYGIFTRLMRDIGFDYYWYDPYTQNLFAKGFEYPSDCSKIQLITLFETCEHFFDPLTDFQRILNIANNVIFSTELLPNPTPKPEDWWYYGLEHGQHISFYSKKTLEFIAKMFGLNYYSNKNIHFFTSKKINVISWKLTCKYCNRLLFPLIRKRMKSKTFEDMLFIISKTE